MLKQNQQKQIVSNKTLQEIENDRLIEIKRLETQIANTKSELRVMTVELKLIERDVNKFLDEYYGSLSKVLKTNNNLKLNQNPANSNCPEKNQKFDSLNKIIKKLYNKLSKICHPDIQKDSNINKFFTTVSNAYNERNLKELMRIEEYLSGDNDKQNESPKEKLERLSKEYDKVLFKIRELKNTKKNMVDSPEFELKKQVLWAKMCGEDLIKKIKRDILHRLHSNHSDATL